MERNSTNYLVLSVLCKTRAGCCDLLTTQKQFESSTLQMIMCNLIVPSHSVNERTRSRNTIHTEATTPLV